MSVLYKSAFAGDIRDYIDLKCALGYSASTYDEALRRFDAFCIENYPNSSVMTEQIVSHWLEKRPTENVNGHIRRMLTLKGFLIFLKTRERTTFTIPDGIVGQYKPFIPYLYSDSELDRFFSAADTIPKHPIAVNREIVIPVIFRLLFCCGLRPPEPLKIKVKEVDFATGTIYIADSKVHKDRIVAMSEELRNLCRKYDDMMQERIPQRIYFFQRPDGKPYDTLWLQRAFHFCIKRSELSFCGQRPRVYDWRHNFATRVIQKWIRNEIEVEAMLPKLSTYMGHTSLEDTAYYIHLIPEHLERNHINEWACIPEVPVYED